MFVKIQLRVCRLQNRVVAQGGARRLPSRSLNQPQDGSQEDSPDTQLLPPAVTEEGPLPRDWEEHQTADGQTYYYNTVTDVTQWERPPPEDAPADTEVDAGRHGDKKDKKSKKDKKDKKSKKDKKEKRDQSPPMTPPNEAGPLSWTCARCTVENAGNAVTCTVCGAAAPVSAEEGSWVCQSCTVVNTADAACCSVCESPAPWLLDQAAADPHSAAQSAPVHAAPQGAVRPESGSVRTGAQSLVAPSSRPATAGLDTTADFGQRQQAQRSAEIAAAAAAATAVSPLQSGAEASGAEQSLPSGWVQLVAEDGEPYFHHAAAGLTQWEFPKPGDAPAIEEKGPLPRDWEEHQTEDGQIYYYNTVTDVTQWARPVQDDAPGAADAAAIGSWACAVCTVENSVDDNCCVVCDAPAPWVVDEACASCAPPALLLLVARPEVGDTVACFSYRHVFLTMRELLACITLDCI